MGKIKQINNNFTSGIVSPLLNSRIDFNKTQNALETCDNFKVLVEGGLTVRPGSLFSVEVKDSSKQAVLIPFRAGLSGNYVLEFGDLYMRVHKKAGVVVNASQAITAITKANPAVVTYSGADTFAAGDRVYITGVVGMTEVNDTRIFYRVGTVDTALNTFTLLDRDGNNVNSTGFTTYVSGGSINEIFELTTPYVEADLESLRYTQNQDTLTITHQNYSPRDISRTSDIAWTITSYMKDAAAPSTTLIVNDGPYQATNTAATTLTPSGGAYATGDTPTVTASSTTGINADQGFLTTDIGRLLAIDNAGARAWGEIVTRVSSTVVTVTVKGVTSFPSTAQTLWNLGAWSDTTGFPRLSTYFQQRQWFFSTKEELDRIDGSAINDFLGFAPDVDDADAISIFLPLSEVNAIYWVTGSGPKLRIGTSSQIWSVWGGSDNIAITPTNIVARPEEKTASKAVQPIDLGNITLFLNTSGKKLYELFYSFEQDALVTRNLTILSEDRLGNPGDITDLGVKKFTYQSTPFPYVWGIKHDGSLAGLTYARSEEVFGWTDHNIGGTNVVVESLATLYDDVEDIIFLIVKRTINGTTRRYVEKLDTLFRGRVVEDAIFFDSSVKVEGTNLAATLTLSAVSGSSVTATAGSAVFSSTDVGRVIKATTGRAIITGYTSTTVITVKIVETFLTVSLLSGEWNISISSVSGLKHLEGQTVRVLVNGGQLASDKTVSSGAISLGGQYNKVIVGLDYTKQFKLLRREGGSDLGTNLGSRVKISDLFITYFETVGGQVGTDSSSIDAMVFRKGTDLPGKGIEPQSGTDRRKPPGGWQDDLSAYYKQPNGLPSTILSMTFKAEVND